jgi:nitrate reductase NapAB chaperone NapD
MELMFPIAFMFLQCREGTEDAILENVRSISGVAYAYKLDSLNDVVIKIESNSVEQFTFAIAAIRKVANILNTDTMVGFK